MSDASGRKVFNTVESNFLEAGVQMDLEASAAPTAGDDPDDEPGPSRWSRFVTLALGRWGAVALVGTGVFVIGGASFRSPAGDPAVTATLAVVETSAAHAARLPTSLPNEFEPGGIAVADPLAAAPELLDPIAEVASSDERAPGEATTTASPPTEVKPAKAARDRQHRARTRGRRAHR